MKKFLKSLIIKDKQLSDYKLSNNNSSDDLSQRKWYRLDNSAKLYPVIMKKSYVSVFRISADLDSDINPDILQNSLNHIFDRFPYYKVRLRRGFFWYYFERNDNTLEIEKDVQNPCDYMKRKENKGFLIRVRYYRKRIAVEFFHGLTDAAGAAIFLKTLVAEYLLRNDNIQLSYGKGVFDPKSTPDPEEYEDSYNKYAEFKVVKRPDREKAYKIKATPEFPHTFHIITGIVPLDKLKATTKTYKVSVTEYLAAVLIQAIYIDSENTRTMRVKRPIQISVPVNMRNIYPSKTMRNFSLFTSPGIEPAYGNYTFNEILHNVHHYMRFQLNSKYMNALMCANVSSEKNSLIKIVPLFIKNIAMMIGYKKFGIHKFSATFSNFGILDAPDELKEKVNRFDMIVGPCTFNPLNIGVLSYKDKLYINVSDTVKEKNIQKLFFRHLVKDGIPVKIDTNEVW